MALENANYIPELDQTNPDGNDPVSQGDDHLRTVKRSVLNSFPGFVGTTATPKSVTLTEDEINDAAQKAADNAFTGANTFTEINGILAADLLSRIVAEAITGLWAFDGDMTVLGRKGGFRNPNERQESGATDTIAQSDEGASVRYVGATTTVDVPSLENKTTVTLKNAGSGLVTLDATGVTFRVFGEGVPPTAKTGATIAVGGLCQLHWVSTTIVDVWGQGVVST